MCTDIAIPGFWLEGEQGWQRKVSTGFLDLNLSVTKLFVKTGWLTEGQINRRIKGPQRMSWLDGITDSIDMTLSKLWETVKDRKAWRAAVHGIVKSQTRLCERTTQQQQTTLSRKKNICLLMI